MFKFKKKITAAIVICVSAAAIAAKMYGPFPVQSAGRSYVVTGFDQDQETDFQAAGIIVRTFVAAVVRTPADQAKAMLNGDYVRVVYADGQIADFTFQFNSSISAKLLGKVPAANFKRLSQKQLDDVDRRNNTCVTSAPMTVSYSTGYMGQSAEIGSDGSTMTITASWVDTGPVSVTFHNTLRCQYR